MKTKSLFFTMLTLIVCFLTTMSFGQTAVTVGKVSNATTFSATVTNVAEATRILKKGLPDNVVITDIFIGYFKEEDKYYLVGNVSNATISSRGLQLSQDGGILRSIGVGPGVEITCNGYNCSACHLKFASWKPFCSCETKVSADYRCDMSSKVSL